MPDASSNGRPLSSHDRHLDSDFARANHTEHVAIHNALCMTCGCCWCCDDDCCAEYTCPNPDCGCSDKPQPTCVLPPAECGICGGPLDAVGTSRCYEAHGVTSPGGGRA